MKKIHFTIYAFPGEDLGSVRSKGMEALSRVREIQSCSGQIGVFGQTVKRNFKVERHFAAGEQKRIDAELDRMGVL